MRGSGYILCVFLLLLESADECSNEFPVAIVRGVLHKGPRRSPTMLRLVIDEGPVLNQCQCSDDMRVQNRKIQRGPPLATPQVWIDRVLEQQFHEPRVTLRSGKQHRRQIVRDLIILVHHDFDICMAVQRATRLQQLLCTFNIPIIGSNQHERIPIAVHFRLAVEQKLHTVDVPPLHGVMQGRYPVDRLGVRRSARQEKRFYDIRIAIERSQVQRGKLLLVFVLHVRSGLNQ
mmetsp:Transcript_27482/g.69014  ORF Transcript_27482/g.69014 Transcript_27482/m.69014 type:complete len:232 (-) Transcript_27482:374-1069(-)